MKLFSPSSCHIYFLSLEPTIIGNQLCPISWVVTNQKEPPASFASQNMIPGYSIPPPTLVAIFAALFHGNSKYFFEKISILYFKYSVARLHAVSPTLSTG